MQESVKSRLQCGTIEWRIQDLLYGSGGGGCQIRTKLLSGKFVCTNEPYNSQ